MKQSKTAWPTILVTAVAVGVAIVASASSGATCCVASPQFAGICKVELAPDETCADVLAYLNNVASVGKTYCGNTQIRVGWNEVTCQKEED
jgi:hypothetical protein